MTKFLLALLGFTLGAGFFSIAFGVAFALIGGFIGWGIDARTKSFREQAAAKSGAGPAQAARIRQDTAGAASAETQAEIAALKKKYGAWLLVDEAHSMGVMGESGRGMVEAASVEQDVDFIVGTFSKSLGSIGGFCVSNHPELDLVRYICRSYVFTASPSPSTIASVREALRVIQSKPKLRTRLWQNATLLYQGLKDLGFEVGPDLSPVVAIRTPSRETTLIAWKALLDKGIYVNLVFPPAAPAGMSLLRCSVSAAHTVNQINCILEAFSELHHIMTERE